MSPPGKRTGAEDPRTATLLHELQTPLTVLRVRLENVLQAPWCGPECRAAIEPCLAGLREASQMVSDLLLLEVDDASEISTERELFPLGELTREVVRHHQVLADRKSISLVVEDVPDAEVRADPRAVRRILHNLFDNAMRYTPAGGMIRIRIRTDQEGVALSVIDEGPGVPTEHQNRIFERFFQIDRRFDRTEGGVGLGLAIARMLAQQSDGRLEVQDTPGQGSTFILRLPTAKD